MARKPSSSLDTRERSPERDPDQLDVFISYSRRDKDLTDALAKSLEDAGFRVIIDRRALPFGEEWQNQLAGFIRECDTVVWLVSPNSVGSKWCNWELGLTQRLSKRLIPVRIADTDPMLVPKALGKIHMLPAEGVYARDQNLQALIDALNTDWSWVKQGTALADRARQWLGVPVPIESDEAVPSGASEIATATPTPAKTDTSALLSGRQLAEAEAWRLRQPPKAPPPSQDVLNLILTSRQAATKRQRWTVAGALAVAVLAVMGSIGIWVQRNEAIKQRDAALANESRMLTGVAQQTRKAGDAASAILTALSALPDPSEGIERPYVPEAAHELYDGLIALREQAAFESPERLLRARFTPDGRSVATMSDDNTLRVSDVKSGIPVAAVKGSSTFGLSQVVWSADASLAAALSFDERARVFLWDVARRAERAVLDPGLGEIGCAAFNRDGSRLVTIAQDRKAHIWDTASGRLVTSIDIGEEAKSAAFSPDGKSLATGLESGWVSIWDIESRQLLASQLLPTFSAKAIFFSPDGETVVAAGSEILIWSWKTNSPPAVPDGAGDVTSATLDTKGTVLVTGSRNNTAQLWDLQTASPRIPALSHSGAIMGTAISPDGRRAATASSDGTLRIWDTGTGRELATLTARTGPLADVAFAPDGRSLVTAGGRHAHLWATEPLGLLQGHTDRLGSGVFSRDSARLVTVSSDRTARLWNIATDSEIALLKHTSQEVVAAAFGTDGDQLVTVSTDGTAQHWNGATGAHLGEALRELDNWGGLSVIRSDAKRLLTATDGRNGPKTVSLWDVEKGRRLSVLIDPRGAQHDTIVDKAAFSPDGQLLATHARDIDSVTREGSQPTTYDTDSAVLLWNAETGEYQGALVADGAPVTSFAFSNDGRRLGTLQKLSVQLWDLTTKARTHAIKVPETAPLRGRFVIFSPDDKTLFTILDRTVDVWDAATGKRKLTFAIDPNFSSKAAVTPDGEGLVTVHDDSRELPSRHWLRLWNTKTGEAGPTLIGHTSRITSVSISPDGTRLATSSNDHTARLWPVAISLQGLEALAKRAVSRCPPIDPAPVRGKPQLPIWCITGPGLENEQDTAKWKPKWPYQGAEWKQWLLDTRAGKSPALPSGASKH